MESRNNHSLVGLKDILEAKRVIAGQVHRTPMIGSTALGRRIGAGLYFKAENFQKTGSFKVRGALNKLKNLTEVEKARGVITISAGNHAQGLAYAASLLEIEVTVVMPQAAVKSKVEATREYGASVILHGSGKDLMSKCQELQQERGLTFVPPFDDLLIIAGQGTVGLEILEDMPSPDVVVVPVGGGGLISGVATALKASNPAIKIIGVEPVGAAVMSQSLQQNKVVHLDKADTIADGLAAPFAGEYTLAHVKRYVDDMVLVSDEEIIEALRLILERCKLLAEPSGAAGFAALLSKKITIPQGAQVVCVLSGGNIDRSRLKEIL
ncbi:MAG TPA: threonine/serine dehydratase [Ktedonobacteraceae bacterium]|nr:threonine/serine dehydratase [Ktedonobacteraceae bacterium]